MHIEIFIPNYNLNIGNRFILKPLLKWLICSNVGLISKQAYKNDFRLTYNF